jgi:hypothetical protein
VAGDDLVVVERSVTTQHYLFELQRATLSVVEHVQRWREGLLLPHPFMVGGDNYLLKIMVDMSLLARDAAMAESLPMQDLFIKYPLCSNLPSLCRFAEDPGRLISATAAKRRTVGAPAVDVQTTRRLAAAEGVLHEELEAQVGLVHQLLELCQKKRFVPILNIKKLYPQVINKNGVVRGVQILCVGEQQRLEATLLYALSALRSPALEKKFAPQT